jgi:hypothetical protein
MSYRVSAPAGALGFSLALLISAPQSAAAQAAPVAAPELPVARIALFSSGVGYFEHEGRVSGDAVVPMAFRVDEVDDALKSLTVRSGEGGQSPSVSYPSREDEVRALKAFRVDLSGSPDTVQLYSRLRGVSLSFELVGKDARKLTGRVLGVERRQGPFPSEPGAAPIEGSRVFINLLTDRGYESLPLDTVAAFRFTDPLLAADFNRAVEYLAAARDKTRTSLSLRLPGTGSREVSFGYVVAAPVWKATYRLDLSGAKPFLQGWAAVDNATDRDWRGVVLSLVSGRPVSFIQNLYAPVYLDRPVVPLSIAGAAAPRTYGEGMDDYPEAALADEDYYEERESMAMAAPAVSARSMKSAEMAPPAPAPKKAAAGGAAARDFASAAFDAARARSAGDQFEFTVATPIDLDRGKSALLPLVAGAVDAERVSIFTAGMERPVLGARLSNSTGMKLPAGPVTVFDGGVYAGDALLDFLNEKDRRLIAFGEDLAVTAAESASSSQETVAVTILKGVLTFSRRVSYAKTYEFRNAAARDKTLVVEHPERAGAELFQPARFLEKADGKYRFTLPIKAGAQASLAVVERAPAMETVALGNLSVDSFLRFSSSSEIPAPVKAALAKAAELKRIVEGHARTVSSLQARRNELVQDQARFRDNIYSLGRDTSEGKKYVARLLDTETELDKTTKRIEETRKAQTEAQASFDAYLANLTI